MSQTSKPAGQTGYRQHAFFGLPLVAAIVFTNGYLLYKRNCRRWLTVNVAAVSAILLGSAVAELILALSNSELLKAVVDENSKDLSGAMDLPRSSP